MRGTRSSVCVNDNSGSYNLIQQRGVHSASSKRSVSPFKNLWPPLTFCHSNRNVQRKLCSKPPTAEHYKCLPTPKKSCMLFTGTFGQISAVNFLSGAGYKRVCASNRLRMAQARQSRRMCGRRYFYQRWSKLHWRSRYFFFFLKKREAALWTYITKNGSSVSRKHRIRLKGLLAFSSRSNTRRHQTSSPAFSFILARVCKLYTSEKAYVRGNRWTFFSFSWRRLTYSVWG